MVSQKDREVLRALGEEYMSFATLPVQQEKVKLWRALNRGEMVRPMINLDQLPWNELEIGDELTLQVEDPFFRKVEDTLRKQIYQWKHFPGDMVLDPYITIPLKTAITEYGLAPQVERLNYDSTSDVDSQHYEVLLQEMEDVEKIKDRKILLDREGDRQVLEEAENIFQGVAPVRLSHGFQFHLGVWDYLTQLMGVTNIYIDLMDRPEFLHACMERVTQAAIAGIEQANALQLHDDLINTCHCSYIFTDDLLTDRGEGKGPVSKNCWAFGLAQLFTSVSPAVTEEFELPYITRMAEYFGGIYYGCCDRLDDRLDIIKRIPNLKKVSCSPWSNREQFAERIGPKLVMSNKPNPALLAGSSFDEEEIRKDITRTVNAAAANHVNLELIQKDVSTVGYDPTRLTRWAEIAMEVISSRSW